MLWLHSFIYYHFHWPLSFPLRIKINKIHIRKKKYNITYIQQGRQDFKGQSETKFRRNTKSVPNLFVHSIVGQSTRLIKRNNIISPFNLASVHQATSNTRFRKAQLRKFLNDEIRRQ